MNIDQAKAITLVEILSRLDIHPRKTSPDKQLYLSPVRQEKTPSFYIYLKTNRWHDFGDGRGGDAIDFAQAYLKFTREADTTADALRWLKNMGTAAYEFKHVDAEPQEAIDEASLILKKAGPIQHLGLIRYLEKRGIPLGLARNHLKEIHVCNQRTKKSFFALGLANEENGYELRNPFFKGCLGVKAITFIRGTEPKPKTIHLFEGMMDYLSTAAHLKDRRFKGDTIILNSLVCLSQITPYIQNYGYRQAFTWLDNDASGEKATLAFTDFIKTQHELIHLRMNQIYAPHKDVNAWHMHSKGLVL